MLITKKQSNWLATVTDDWTVLEKYCQINFRCILNKCKEIYSKQHVNIVANWLKRKSVVSYNRLKIRGGFPKRRKRSKQKIWRFYGLAFTLTKRKKAKRINNSRKSRARAKAPQSMGSKNSSPSKEKEKTDDTEFLYYQSSDDEIAEDVGIVNISEMAPPTCEEESDTENNLSETCEEAASAKDAPVTGKVADKSNNLLEPVLVSLETIETVSNDKSQSVNKTAVSPPGIEETERSTIGNESDIEDTEPVEENTVSVGEETQSSMDSITKTTDSVTKGHALEASKFTADPIANGGPVNESPKSFLNTTVSVVDIAKSVFETEPVVRTLISSEIAPETSELPVNVPEDVIASAEISEVVNKTTVDTMAPPDTPVADLDETMDPLTISGGFGDEEPLDNNDTSICTRYSNDSTMEASDVTDKLRQQLELLKKGKGEANLLGSRIGEKVSESRRSSGSLGPPSRRPTVTEDRPSRFSRKNSSSTLDKASVPKEPSLNNSIESNSSLTRTGFIDSLINKLKSVGPVAPVSTSTPEASTSSARYVTRQRRKSISGRECEPDASATKIFETPTKKVNSSNKTDERETRDDTSQSTSCSSPEFFGFVERDTIFKGTDLSGLLPTPRVQKTSGQTTSVFESEDLNTFMKENALDNLANVTMPSVKRKYDEALLTADAEPPSMTVPERPTYMERPRTLAEKRLLFQKKKDIKYLMIENESTVYHELKKRKKDGASFDNTLLKGLLDGNMPFTRDCWRATCWLSTDQNKFFFQTVKHGDEEIKVFSGRGNYKSKILCEIDADMDKKDDLLKVFKKPVVKCSRVCRSLDKVKIRNLDEHVKKIETKIKKDVKLELITTSTEPPRKMNMMTTSSRSYTKPGPLSTKYAPKRTSVDVEFGPFTLFTLPTIQLEIWPKLEQPLPEIVQPYMKLILPHEHITDEWAKFAVSAMKAPRPPPKKQRRKFKKEEDADICSFSFHIPYENNQKRILVRKRRMHEHTENVAMDDAYVYEFAKNVDQTDNVAVECADTLMDMITSVAITAHENSFIKRDPDIDYVGKLIPIGNSLKNNANKIVPKTKAPSTSSSPSTQNSQKTKIM